MTVKLVVTPVTAYQQNCSLLICEKTQEAVLVDPGGDAKKIQQLLQEHNARLVNILLTHGHIDHVGAAQTLAVAYHVPILGPHPDDKFWLDGLEDYAAMIGFEPVKPFEPTQWLHHGDEITFGACKLEVYHCPGHTPGHVVFLDRVSHLAFVGDVIFNGSIGRTDFPQGDHAALINSIVHVLWPMGSHIQFVPGHGPMSTFAEERAHNPFVADSVLGR